MAPHYNSAWINLTPENGEYMFGYYDRLPWNADNSLHLALKIPRTVFLPEPGEKAEVGYIHRETRRFIRVAHTRAWCHQQGAMTLWLKHLKDTFIFNDYLEQENKPCARIYGITSGEIGIYDKPVYSISRDGKWGSSLNFGRIPRRGYSYADLPISRESDLPDLDNDGLSLINLKNGSHKLIAPYRRLLEEHPFPYALEGTYYYLAHSAFNCDSSRIMVLFEQVAAKNDSSSVQTNLFTMNIDGSDLMCALPSPYWHDSTARAPDRISHQIWGRSPREILVDANWFGRGNQYVVFDESMRSMKAKKLSDGFGPHGHLVFSPDNMWIAADTYPDKHNIERLGIVNAETGEAMEIGRFTHDPASPLADLRCDLHPRWSEDSKIITIDTIHEGARKIYMFELA